MPERWQGSSLQAAFDFAGGSASLMIAFCWKVSLETATDDTGPAGFVTALLTASFLSAVASPAAVSGGWAAEGPKTAREGKLDPRA